MTEQTTTKAAILEHLARCGMLFMQGEPPPALDHYILAYTGGCNAIRASWDAKKGCYVDEHGWRLQGDPSDFNHMNSKKRLLGKIDCWMYLPHPSIWPEIEGSPDRIPEQDLYNNYRGDVFSWFGAPDKVCGD